MRIAPNTNLRSCNYSFPSDVCITPEMIQNSIQHCYDTLDTIDKHLVLNGSQKLSQLIETANLSSIIGNLLGAGLAKYSNEHYTRNKPHTYPDLLPLNPELSGIELKTAIERNLPKGHHPKPGYYIVYRYALTDSEGNYTKGMEFRGDTVTIWEVKFGYLNESDFMNSNTARDSGKTSIVKTGSLNALPLLYLNDQCIPFKHSSSSPYNGYN